MVQLNVSEIREMRVLQKNDLIQKARHQLNERDLKLVDFMISKVKADDKELLTVHTSIPDIVEIMGFGKGGKTYREVINSLLSLANKGFWFKHENSNKRFIARWLDKVIIDETTLECELKLDNEIAPYLLEIEGKNYTQYYLKDVVNISGKYAILLYKLARSESSKGIMTGTPEEWMDYFGKNNEAWYRFNDRYLKKAIKEVNNKTELCIEMVPQKFGRQTIKVDFMISEKKRINSGIINEK